jgi:hypothetical protein
MKRVRAIIERSRTCFNCHDHWLKLYWQRTVAKANYHKGLRKDRPLVSFNCGSFPTHCWRASFSDTQKGVYSADRTPGRTIRAGERVLSFCPRLMSCHLRRRPSCSESSRCESFSLRTSRTVPLDARVIAAIKDMRNFSRGHSEWSVLPP